jgi:nucleoid-associated protein YgaU
VVRVDREGNAVIAGRAAAASTVVVLDDGREIGRVVADHRGEWVFVPTAPLPPGSQQLSLEMLGRDGERIESESAVVLLVPERPRVGAAAVGGDAAGGRTPAGAIALKVEPAGASTLLQKPAGDRPMALTVDAVDYDEQAQVAVSGSAPPGARVQLYLDNAFIGRATAGGDGVWRVVPEVALAPGMYTLRADQVEATGRVAGRVALPFVWNEPPKNLRPGAAVIVQPGDSLWLIARRAYGSGVQYTLIFEANRTQIRDPDLIYPGQIFGLPVAN